MSNIVLLEVELLVCLLTILIVHKYFKSGTYIYSIITFILSNIMSLKTISISNFDINLGIIPFVTVFISANIIVQKKGKEEAKKLILALIASSIISYAILYTTTFLTSSNINLFTSASYDNIFLNSARIYFANIVTMLYSLLISINLYQYLKRIKNKIWISNLFSSIIVHFISATLFPIVAYALILEPIAIIKLIIIRYMISLITSVLGTIIIYITNKMKVE